MIQSFKVLTTLAANRIVCCSTTTAHAVIYPASNSDFQIGVTLDTVADTTQSIPVAMAGEIAKVLFNDTCTTGTLVAGDSSGRAVPFTLAATSTAISAPAAYVGVMVGPRTDATGAVSDILILPGYDRKSA